MGIHIAAGVVTFNGIWADVAGGLDVALQNNFGLDGNYWHVNLDKRFILID